eukprot:TRINITY_DN82457_c0_g1_i1.p1 TRINITY_DN82457_c0_g1~~TRINITY_DN82457_c0_g1_i1.p1  ORF type:complete len:747 (-),score=123.41 TRINITY_DN82457_c0_g1_i1:186-2330(-)
MEPCLELEPGQIVSVVAAEQLQERSLPVWYAAEQTGEAAAVAAMSASRETSVVRSLAAGAAAGCVVDVALFPLDSLKTRLQSKECMVSGKNLRNIYSGLPVVMFGNAIGSAVFFATYEYSKACLKPTSDCNSWRSVLADSASAAAGEMVACTFRTPTEILKQRMQALQVGTFMEGVRSVRRHDLLVGFRATASRDLVFSSLQYPAYEYLKRKVVRLKYRNDSSCWHLSALESALCGSLTSSITAVATTPLDVVKTRVMLDRTDPSSGGGSRGVLPQIALLYQEEGLPGFFRGATCRGLWMGLGGMLFLGSYEKAKTFLHGDGPSRENFIGRYMWNATSPSKMHAQTSQKKAETPEMHYRRCWYTQPSSGGSPDAPTVGRGGEDPRWQQELMRQAAERNTSPVRGDALAESGKRSRDAAHNGGTAAAGTATAAATAAASTAAAPAAGLSDGNFRDFIGVELLSGGIAGCAVDTVLHPIDSMKTRLQSPFGFWEAGGFRNLWRGVSASLLPGIPASAVFWAFYAPLKMQLTAATGSNTQAEVLAGPVSEMASLTVRVPSEVVKQRMQAGLHKGSLSSLAKNIYGREGLAGFYVGFTATCCRSVPFAFIQFPVYEELKRRMDARFGSINSWWTGGASGAMAGGIAAVVTTPLDVIKTRVILASPETRKSFTETLRMVSSQVGFGGLFAGAVPRGVQLSLGGMVYLGVYNAVADHLRK